MIQIISFFEDMYIFLNKSDKVWRIKCLISRIIAQFQYERNLFAPFDKWIDPKELFLCQCNGLELNRPEITIQYLAVKDIAGNLKDGEGLRLYNKYSHVNCGNSKYSSEDLTVLVNRFASHGYNHDSYVTCEKNMEILDGIYVLACALFFDEKKIRVRSTITNWNQKPTWNLLIGAGFSEDDIDYIRHESDLLIERLLKSQKIDNLLDNQALRKWILKESKKEFRFYKTWINYQSFPMLGINGTRQTDIRIKQYGLKDLLNKSMDVLDIGCNIGFMDMEIAYLVRNVTGIEYIQEVSRFSKKVANKLNIQNVTFISADFKEWKNLSHRKYDMIFSFAVYHWIDLSPHENALKIASLIKPGGFVIFEGHNIADTICNDYNYYIDAFINNGFWSIKSDYIMDDGVTKRIWTLLQYKKN